MIRKFKHYIIKNSGLEQDNFNFSENIEAYREALKAYSKIKDTYKDTNQLIEFFGVLPNGESELLFYKKYEVINKEDNEPQENIYNLLDKLNNIIQDIEQRIEYANGMFGSYDKKLSVVVHEIENSNENISDIQKIQIFNNLKDITTERRFNKHESDICNLVGQELHIKNFKEVYERAKKSIVRKENKGDAIKTGKIVPDTLIVKEIPYKDHKERISLFSQMQKKYDRVAYDENRKVIICYNKCMNF